MDDIYQDLTPVFQEVFDDESVVVTPELTARDVADWDSLSHIRLMVAIEQRFAIHFSASEITSFKNVGELVASIQAKRKK